MALTLQLVNETNLPDGGPVSYRITGKRGLDIGRDAHLDWTLPDPTRYISSKHCEIRYKDGGYWLHDASTNGTFVNDSDQRMAGPHRLRNGDRFAVGHYIVAVTIEGEEGAAEPAPQSAAAPAYVNDQELWASHENIPPPIDPKQLKPARQAQVHSDFLDWAADVPDPFQASRAYAAPPSARPGPASRSGPPVSPDMDWEAGPSPHLAAAPPPPPPTPAPRRPGAGAAAGGAWDDIAPAGPAFPAAAGNVPQPPSAVTAAPIPAFAADTAGVPARAAAAAITPPSYAAPPDAFVRALAKAAGLPEDALAQKDPIELAQQVGSVLRLVAENLTQLLDARREGKRLARSANHTTVEAVDNNPLKFSPSPADALRIMFGPATPSYLNAQQAIGQGFGQVKAHQIKTYSAMQHAVNALMADLDPQVIEQRSEEGRGVTGLLASRKSKLWDAYTAQWDSKISRDGGGPIAAFMVHFAGFYDRDGG